MSSPTTTSRPSLRGAQAFRAALRSATEAWPTTTSLTRPDLHHHASTALA